MIKKVIRILFAITIAIILFSSCELTRCVVYNVPGVNDYKIFSSRTIKSDISKFFFAKKDNSDLYEILEPSANDHLLFDNYLEAKGTLAFLIIHKDTIVYEKYFKNYDQSSVIPSFSVAKSFISTLIGCAINDGYIKSINDPITDYIPELKKNKFNKVTIKNLLKMTSGINFHESYRYFANGVPMYYYGINLRRKINRLKLKSEPGTQFEYSSANAELLGLVLERALKTKTITSYLEEKIWLPLGMEYDATWSIDRKKNGIEKTFCCINACARDYAKFGRLYLNKGNWNGKQIVPEDWVKESTKIDTANGGVWNYQYQWWIASDNNDYYARGMLGEFVYINPKKDLVIVRLGERGGGVNWPQLFISLSGKFQADPEGSDFYSIRSGSN